MNALSEVKLVASVIGLVRQDFPLLTLYTTFLLLYINIIIRDAGIRGLPWAKWEQQQYKFFYANQTICFILFWKHQVSKGRG